MQRDVMLVIRFDGSRKTLLPQPVRRMKLLQEHTPHQTRLILLRATSVKSTQTFLSKSTTENEIAAEIKKKKVAEALRMRRSEKIELCIAFFYKNV